MDRRRYIIHSVDSSEPSQDLDQDLERWLLTPSKDQEEISTALTPIKIITSLEAGLNAITVSSAEASSGEQQPSTRVAEVTLQLAEAAPWPRPSPLLSSQPRCNLRAILLRDSVLTHHNHRCLIKRCHHTSHSCDKNIRKFIVLV